MWHWSFDLQFTESGPPLPFSLSSFSLSPHYPSIRLVNVMLIQSEDYSKSDSHLSRSCIAKSLLCLPVKALLSYRITWHTWEIQLSWHNLDQCLVLVLLFWFILLSKHTHTHSNTHDISAKQQSESALMDHFVTFSSETRLPVRFP